MKKHTLHIRIPPNWFEVPNKIPRSYRRRSNGSGWVQISLYPPETELNGDGEKIRTKLNNLLKSLDMDFGKEITGMHLPCASGTMATSMYQSPKQGLLQFWLIPSDALIFVSYTMGDILTVKEEVAEAHKFIAELKFETNEVFDI